MNLSIYQSIFLSIFLSIFRYYTSSRWHRSSRNILEIYNSYVICLMSFFLKKLTPMSSGHGLIRIGCGDFFCIILKNHFHMNLNNSQPTTPMSWGVSGEHVQPCMETWCWLVTSQLLCHDVSSIQTAQSCNDAFLLAVHPRSKYSYVMRSCCYMWPHRRP